MGKQSSRTKLTAAALDLFEQHGYDQTTVDMIAEHAGLSRTTFFRLFPTKEDVALIDHASLLQQIKVLFHNSSREQAMATLTNAAFVILKGYLDEGELAVRRYRLSRTVPSLYVRELSSMHVYELTFRKFIKEFIYTDTSDMLRIELLASSVTTASNHVLRTWLRGSTQDPIQDFNAAMNRAVSQALAVDSHQLEDSRNVEYLVIRSDSEAASLLFDITNNADWKRVVIQR